MDNAANKIISVTALGATVKCITTLCRTPGIFENRMHGIMLASAVTLIQAVVDDLNGVVDSSMNAETAVDWREGHIGHAELPKQAITTAPVEQAPIDPRGELLTCPKCGKQGREGRGRGMSRWHFDNCGKVVKPATLVTPPAFYEQLRVISTCPHCGVTGKGPIMKRYHFNRCRKKPMEAA